MICIFLANTRVFGHFGGLDELAYMWNSSKYIKFNKRIRRNSSSNKSYTI